MTFNTPPLQLPMKLKSLSDLQQLLPESAQRANVADPGEHDGRGKEVRLLLDTKGRKGKSVTIVSGLQHNPTTMKDIARALKEYCGTGGTVKGRHIELQGDQRVRAAEKLQRMNYSVK
jgi:predicted translation initiation factor SUI1